jgi:hypothetical protein
MGRTSGGGKGKSDIDAGTADAVAPVFHGRWSGTLGAYQVVPARAGTLRVLVA